MRAEDRIGRPFTPSLPSSRAMTYVDEEPVEPELVVNGSTTTSTFEMPSLTELQPAQVNHLKQKFFFVNCNLPLYSLYLSSNFSCTATSRRRPGDD